MLTLKPLAVDWSVAGAKFPSSHFHYANRVENLRTRTYVRLLGPCFKTGRKAPYGQQLVHALVFADTFAHPEAGYHVPAFFQTHKPRLTDKARSTTHVLLNT